MIVALAGKRRLIGFLNRTNSGQRRSRTGLDLLG
jgi:hypothetical protein